MIKKINTFSFAVFILFFGYAHQIESSNKEKDSVNKSASDFEAILHNAHNHYNNLQE